MVCTVEYHLPNIVSVTKSRIIMLGVLVSAGKQINACKVLVNKYEGKIPFERHKCKWEYNTKVDLQGIERKAVDWTNSSQGREKWRAVLSTVMSLRFP